MNKGILVALTVVGVITGSVFAYWLSCLMHMWAFIYLQDLFADYILWEPISNIQALVLTLFVSLFWVRGQSNKSSDDKTDWRAFAAALLSPVILVLTGKLVYAWFIG